MMPIHISRTSTDYLRKIKVLVVDSDQRIIDLMVNVLQHLGFRDIFGARDGFRAVQTMRGHDIDLIITDWELRPFEEEHPLDLPPNPVIYSELWTPVPPEDGACLVKYIRASKYSPNPYVPVIMLTGLGLRDHIEYARDCGVNEIMLKPLSMERLCQRITAIIDAPRPFVTATAYQGPCRRRNPDPCFKGKERRRKDVKVFKHGK